MLRRPIETAAFIRTYERSVSQDSSTPRANEIRIALSAFSGGFLLCCSPRAWPGKRSAAVSLAVTLLAGRERRTIDPYSGRRLD